MDDREYSELSLGDQIAIDAQLDRRDREIARRQGRIPAAFLGDDDDDVLARMPQRRRRRQQRPDGMADIEEDYDPSALVLFYYFFKSIIDLIDVFSLGP